MSSTWQARNPIRVPVTVPSSGPNSVERNGHRAERNSTPVRLIGAVAPVDRPIEDVNTAGRELLHRVGPRGLHPHRVIVGRPVDFRIPDPAVERQLRDMPGKRPGGLVIDGVRLSSQAKENWQA